MTLKTIFRTAHKALERVDILALFPLLALLAFLSGIEAIAWLFLAVLPTLLAIRTLEPKQKNVPDRTRQTSRSEFANALDEFFAKAQSHDLTTAVMVIDIEELFLLHGKWGAQEARLLMDKLSGRIAHAMRKDDMIARLDENRLAIALSPVPRVGLEVTMSLVDRLQSAVSEPMVIDGKSLRAQSNIGLCTLDQAPAQTSEAMFAAAECALLAARRVGGGAVRVFTPEMQREREAEHKLTDQVADALDTGAIRAWYQPQISTETGAITGFEVLARWHHPELGVLTPGHFLPAIKAAHKLPQLGDVMLQHGIEALKSWDASGLRVPCLGLNLSLEELRDPRLADSIAWQVDRFDLRPERICIEILETVALADGDDAVTANLSRLRSLGFRLDLDDFGTGQSSIGHVARFGVDRIKIDRSFVFEIENDPQKKQVLAAIIAMADQLGIDTLAEGVETAQARGVLAQMGCTHVQGYAIARPMPFEDTLAWATAHNAQIAQVPMIKNRRKG